MTEASEIEHASEQPLSRARLTAYGAPAVPLQVLLTPLLIFLPTFYATELGLGLATVGTLFLLARAWDALTDPIIGALSDRTQSRIGRRKPWIIIGTPLLMIASYFVLIPGANLGLLTAVFSIAIFYVFWTMIFIPYQSWGAEIQSGYEDRTRAAGFREGGAVLGVLVGIGIPLLLIDPVAEPLRNQIWPDGIGLDTSLRSLHFVIFVTFVVLLPISIAASCFFVPDTMPKKQLRYSWKQTATILLRNKPFQRLFAGYFVAQLGFLAFLSAVQLLITRALEIEAFLFLIFLQNIVAILAVPLWLRIANRFGKSKAYCASLLIIAIGFFALALIQPGDLGMAVAVFLFNGLGSSGKLILPASIAADTVDYDTLKTGSSEAGSHLALLNMANKATFAISIGATFLALSMTGFDPASSENSDASIDSLLIVGTLVPALLVLSGMLIMWSYPLSKRRHSIIQRRLARRDHSGQPNA
ncbi:MAG: MFS transporter [Erythrobacter sp.]